MAKVHSWKLVGFGSAALIAGFALAGGGGCSSSSDNTARTGTGGTGGTGATTGGATNTAGTSTTVAGTSSIAGSSTTGGATSGGATSGGASSGGAGADVCGLPTTTAATPVIYDGATTAPTCGTTPKMPWGPVAFAYGDNSVCTAAGKPLDADRAKLMLAPCTAPDLGAIVNAGAKGGCQGAGDCALHVTGSGFTDYGAGIGFDVNDNGSNSGPAVAFDASAYMGLQFWVKGTISGTRGPKYAATPNSLHIKFVTSTARGGDDYGGYCTVGTDWTKCNLTFAAATRDGFSSTPPVATDMLDIMNLLKLQFEFSKFSPAADAGASPPVTFDVMFDDISFF